MAAAQKYTTVTVVPPADWNTGGAITRDNQTVAPDANGRYVFTPLNNVTLAALLADGFTIYAFTV